MTAVMRHDPIASGEPVSPAPMARTVRGMNMQSPSSRRRFLAAAFFVLAADRTRCAVAADRLLDQIKARGTLRIGIEGTYPPFNYQDENGNLVGFEIDFANALAAQLGLKAAFMPTKWDGILAALDSGRLDVVINQVTITPERRQKYDFSEPYTVSGIQIITRTRDAQKLDTEKALAGKKVGVGLGTNYEQWLKEHVPEAEVATYEDDPTKLQDLMVGRIDAVLNDRLMAAYLVKQSGGQLAAAGQPFAKQEAGVALQQGHPELLAALNKGIDALRNDGELARISAKWFGAEVSK
jgi:cystine transport system substrate-binding protein